jgi:UDP-glucose 4-epimerase
LIRAIDEPANGIENLAYGDTRTTREIINTFKEVNNIDFKVNELPRRAGDLEACHLDKPSKYMIQRYSYEEMLKLY